MIMTVRNTTGGDVVIRDLGMFTIAAGETEDILDQLPLYRIADSKGLLEKVLDGSLVVNNGEVDMTAAEGAIYLALQPVAIGPKDPSGKMRVHQSSRPLGTSTLWAGSGDDPTVPKDVGGGATFEFVHEANDADGESQHRLIDLNTIGNKTYLHEALLTWKGADMDKVTAGIVPRTVTVGTSTGTKYILDPGGSGMVLPCEVTGGADSGTTTVSDDLAKSDGGLVQMFEDFDTGVKPPSFWNATWNPTTERFEDITAAPLGDGEFNIFSVEAYLLRFFINVPMLGDGFQIFNSSDTSPIGHGLRIKIEWKTEDAAREWKLAAVLIMHREKTT